MVSYRDCTCDSAALQESRQEPESPRQSGQEDCYYAQSLCMKQEIADSLDGHQIYYEWQSLQEAKTGEIVYTCEHWL